MRLCDIKLNDKVRVVRISDACRIKRRLYDLGLIEGTSVQCVLTSPLGDPTAYLIRGAVIALRREDAKHIEIEVM